MPVTPEALRAALLEHPNPQGACRAVGISKQAAYKRPDLSSVLMEHVAAARAAQGPRNAARKLGERHLAVPAETLARVDALAVDLAAATGRRRPSRSDTARRLLAAALAKKRLPLGMAAPAGTKPVKLDLGQAWDRVGDRIGTHDPEDVASVVRAVLATQTIDTPTLKKG